MRKTAIGSRLFSARQQTPQRKSGRPVQMLRIMRLTAFLLTVFSLQVAASGNSQTVTLSGEALSLRKLFNAVEKQTGYVVFSNRDLLTAANPVSVNVKDMPLKNFLQLILRNQPLGFRIDNNTIILSRKSPETIAGFVPLKDSVLIFITPVVKDEKGNPLSGVSVKLKGFNGGWTSGPTGLLNIVAKEGAILVISSVGFKTIEVKVQKGLKEIILESEANKLDQVVITGIVNRRAESFTGSAQTYTRQELLKVGNMNVLQSLKNLDPAFNLKENLEIGSDPNALPSVQLRGQSGFPDLKGQYTTDPNQPLFILDGFEVSLTRVIDLDMNRVETITILKDAAAKALYGSKAGNGVVVIETQRPKAGKMQVTYTGKLDIAAPDLRSYNLANAAEKLDVEKSGGLYTAGTSGGMPFADKQYLLDEQYNTILEEVQRGVNTDWLSKPVRTAPGQKHTLYVEGGSDFLRYAVDFSYNNVKGTMKGSERNTTSGGVTLSYRYKNVQFRNNLDVSFNKGTNSPYGNFADYARMNPYFRPTDAAGNITKIAGENIAINSPVGNPLWNASLNTKDFTRYTQIINNFYAEWFVTQGLKLTGRISVTRKEEGEEQFFPASHTMFINYTTDDLVKRKGNYTLVDGYNNNTFADINASYSKTLGKHAFFTNGGWSISNADIRRTGITAEGFPNDYLDDISFARQYLQNSRPAGTESTTRDIGILSLLNYSYDDRFLVDGSFRLNASSQFGADNRWGKFWSAGLGWNLHKEPFARHWRNVDQLKLRGSVGYTGSQNFNSYQSKSTFAYNTTDTYLGFYGAYLLGLSNEKLQWQRKYDQNVGIDLSMFNRALTVRVDYYIANTNDLLTDVTVPSSTGFTSYKENLGKVQNTGLEFRVGYRVWADNRKGNFLSFFVSGIHNKNRIQQISNSLNSYNKEQAALVTNKPVVRYAEGQSMSAIWAVPSYGIDPASGRDIFITANGNITHTWNADDLAVLGDTESKLRGNTGFNFDYNGVSINASMNWRFGGQIYNQTLVDKVENANLNYNVDKRVYDNRWRKPGDVSMFKDIRNRAVTRATQRFVQDQNDWVLSSVSIAYDLNRLKAFQSPKINRLRVSLNMNDVTQVSSVRIERGTAYPFARTFSFSIQAMF